MKGVLALAAVVLALMIVIKDGRLLRQAGLSGSCTRVLDLSGEAPGRAERLTVG